MTSDDIAPEALNRIAQAVAWLRLVEKTLGDKVNVSDAWLVDGYTLDEAGPENVTNSQWDEWVWRGTAYFAQGDRVVQVDVRTDIGETEVVGFTGRPAVYRESIPAAWRETIPRTYPSEKIVMNAMDSAYANTCLMALVNLANARTEEM